MFRGAARRGNLFRNSPATRHIAPPEPNQPPGTSEAVTIRIFPEELTRARTLAAKRGLRYQTYVKMLLHEALDAEEKKPWRGAKAVDEGASRLYGEQDGSTEIDLSTALLTPIGPDVPLIELAQTSPALEP